MIKMVQKDLHQYADTSQEHYKELISSGRLGKLQNKVLVLFREYPISTDRQISEISGLPINVVTARRNELYHEGWIENKGKVKLENGRHSIVWVGLEKRKLLKRPQKVRCSACGGSGFILKK